MVSVIVISNAAMNVFPMFSISKSSNNWSVTHNKKVLMMIRKADRHARKGS